MLDPDEGKNPAGVALGKLGGKKGGKPRAEKLSPAKRKAIANYNFCRVHQTLRVTPAMEAGLADHVWSIEELVSLIPEIPPAKRGPYKKKVQ